MNTIVALVITIGVVLFLFLLAFIASRFGKREGRELKKKKKISLRIQPRIFLTVVIMFFCFVVGIVFIYLGMFYLPSSVPEIVYILFSIFVVIIIAVGVVLPKTLNRFARGHIELDESGFRWMLKERQGEISWKRPISISKGYFTKSVPIVSRQAVMGVPVYMIVYDIRQDDIKVSLYHDASIDEIKEIPEVREHGIYLHSHGRVVMERILRHSLVKSSS